MNQTRRPARHLHSMKASLLGTSIALAASGLAQPFTLDNPWSGTTGDKANLAGFAFRADAGTYPASVTPPGALGDTFELASLTLIRPNDTVTPAFGSAAVGQLTDASTPVYVDIYTGYAAGTFSGYLGSSTTGVAWSGTVQDQPYTFAFSGITLQNTTQYWFVFSEDGAEGEVSQFRAKVNTSGDNLTPGPGKGYLVNDTVQTISASNAGALGQQDWGVAYTVAAVPEPSTLTLAGLGLGLLLLRRRASQGA